MLRDLFVFIVGGTTASLFIWICEDKIAKRVARQLHLLEQEPRVDMEWFNETLSWTHERKALARKESLPSNKSVKNNTKLADKFTTMDAPFADKCTMDAPVVVELYEAQLQSKILQFMSSFPLNNKTASMFVRAYPPPGGRENDVIVDMLSWLDGLELREDPDCKTYARLVRAMYEQVNLMFCAESCTVDTPTIRRITVEN